MTRTEFARYTTGSKLYAHLRPAEDVLDWVSEAVRGVEDSTVAGQYRFENLIDDGSYEVYVESGAEPSRTDLAIWEFLPITNRVVDYPLETDVREGVSYDSGAKVGNLVLPTPNQVADGVQYGANGTEFVGILDAGGGAVPEEEDVRFGIQYGTGRTGVLELPFESQVLLGVGYGASGTEFEGQLQDIPGGVGVVLPPVLANGQLRSPLVIGDAYITELGTAFIWAIDAQQGMEIAGTTARFYGRPKCGGCADDRSWDVEVTPTDSSGTWLLEFEMDGDVTKMIEAGEYEWFLVLEEQGDSLTVESGEVEWICR